MTFLVIKKKDSAVSPVFLLKEKLILDIPLLMQWALEPIRYWAHLIT